MPGEVPPAWALEEFLGLGRGGKAITWDPDLHPRNRVGQFAEVLDSLKPRDSVTLPSGTKVTKGVGGGYHIESKVKDAHGHNDTDVPTFAAQDALERDQAIRPNGRRLTNDPEVDIGVTPYRGAGKATGKDYFETNRYKGFENAVPVEAEANGLTLHGHVERVHGVWAGGSEPAARVRLSGPQKGIERFMDNLGSRYNQDAVISWRTDASGPQRRYVSDGRVDAAKADAAIEKQNKGKSDEDEGYIQGATLRVDGRLELIDMVKSDPSTQAMTDLMDALDQGFEYDVGYGNLRFKYQDYPDSAGRWQRVAQEAQASPPDEGGRSRTRGTGRGDLLLQAARRQALEVVEAAVEFDPRLHPRNRLGEFAAVVGGLRAGQKVRLPTGVTVKRHPHHFTVTPAYAKRGLHVRAATDAAEAALVAEEKGVTDPDALSFVLGIATWANKAISV